MKSKLVLFAALSTLILVGLPAQAASDAGAVAVTADAAQTGDWISIEGIALRLGEPKEAVVRKLSPTWEMAPMGNGFFVWRKGQPMRIDAAYCTMSFSDEKLESVTRPIEDFLGKDSVSLGQALLDVVEYMEQTYKQPVIVKREKRDGGGFAAKEELLVFQQGARRVEMVLVGYPSGRKIALAVMERLEER